MRNSSQLFSLSDLPSLSPSPPRTSTLSSSCSSHCRCRLPHRRSSRAPCCGLPLEPVLPPSPPGPVSPAHATRRRPPTDGSTRATGSCSNQGEAEPRTTVALPRLHRNPTQPPFARPSVPMEDFARVLEDGLKLSKRLVLPGDVPQPRPLMGMYAEGGAESRCRATARARASPLTLAPVAAAATAASMARSCMSEAGRQTVRAIIDRSRGRRRGCACAAARSREHGLERRRGRRHWRREEQLEDGLLMRGGEGEE
jgi:hypothetical protein